MQPAGELAAGAEKTNILLFITVRFKLALMIIEASILTIKQHLNEDCMSDA